MMAVHSKTIVAARGKWRGILQEFGVPESMLRNKHGTCPLCGKDNFRFDDKNGSGSWICTCANGAGVDLVIAFSGQEYRDVSSTIDRILGNISHEEAPRSIDPEQVRNRLRETYLVTTEVVPGDLVHKYLATRGIEEPASKVLRFGPALRDGEGGIRPCMVAMVGVPGAAKYVSMHRTFLRPDGLGKAYMDAPRKMMPGSLPDGACVMLSDYNGGALGIAEGIETAMSAAALYSIPVWSALNTAIMKKWHPPAGCKEVAIFSDNDVKLGGQAAAYHLGHRLSCMGITVRIHVPEMVGQDFNDIWKIKKGI